MERLIGQRFFTIDSSMTMTSRNATETIMYTIVDETEMECVCETGDGHKRTFYKSYVQHMIDSGYLWWPNDIYSKENHGKIKEKPKTDQLEEH